MSVRALLVACMLALPAGGPAAAGSAPSVSVWPVRLTLAVGQAAELHVANASRRAVRLDLAPSGFALDLHGTPRVVPAAGRRLVALRPATLVVRAGGTASVAVRAVAGRGLAAGDHPVLVLLTARPASGAGIGVRVRIGVTIEVRAPGTLRRQFELGALRVRGRTLTVLVVNSGNVAERVTTRTVGVRLVRRGHVQAILRPRPRTLLPRSRGLLEFRLPRRLHGRLTAVVTAAPLRARARSFSVSI